MTEPIAIVILAGGEGSRIGGSKPLRVLGGQTLLEHVLARAVRWSDRLAIAVRDQAQFGELGIRLIHDAPDVAGPLAGLFGGAAFAREQQCETLLLLPCDTPFLPGDLDERLAAGLDQGANAAVASSGGSLHPACSMWRVAALDAAPDYAAAGKQSLRGFAEKVGFQAIEWPTLPHDPFFNINSNADLISAEQIRRTRTQAT